MDKPFGKILIDITPGDDGEFDRSFLERTGHEVVICHGPDAGALCPLLAGAGCEKVEGAHGIVFALDLDDAQHRQILRRYRKVVAPDVPIRAIVRPGQRSQYAELIEQFEVWEQEPTVADLDGFAAEAEAVDRAGG
jgi:hypothetical protein